MTSGVKWKRGLYRREVRRGTDVPRTGARGRGSDGLVHEEAPRETAPGGQMGLQDRRDQSDRRAGDAGDQEAARRLSQREGLATHGMEQDRLLDGRSVRARSQRLLPVGELCATMPGWASSRSRAARASCPADWFANPLAAHADIGAPGRGYGYQWWTYPAGPLRRAGDFRPDDPGGSEVEDGDRRARPRRRRRPTPPMARSERRSSTSCSRRRALTVTPTKASTVASKRQGGDPASRRRPLVHPLEMPGSRTPRPPAWTIRSATTSGGLDRLRHPRPKGARASWCAVAPGSTMPTRTPLMWRPPRHS